MLEDGAVTPIPVGLRPRILDYMCETAKHPRERKILYAGSHFSIGVEASQLLVELTEDWLDDERNSMQTFAPHPFETYTLSMWVGDSQGMSECLLIVDPMKSGEVGASMVTMRWEDDAPIQAGAASMMVGRAAAMAFDPRKGAGDYTSAYAASKASWMFLDVFRLILARPGAARIGSAASKRNSIRKGKRVTYYSASEITIDIQEARRAKTNVATGHGKIMPSYRYRAHLCHSGGSRSCTHYWIAIGGHMDAQEVWHPDAEHGKQNATWECYHCGRKRWARRSGERGDASLGRVRQTYTIKKGKDDFVPTNKED